LDNIFSIFPVPQHPITKSKYLALEPLDKRQHRGLLTFQTAIHQYSEIFHRAIFSGRQCRLLSDTRAVNVWFRR
jgi:hypothetical protein